MTKKNIRHARELAHTARSHERRAARLLAEARKDGVGRGLMYKAAREYSAKASRCRLRIADLDL